MNKDAIKMINGWEILRMDLQKTKWGIYNIIVLYIVYEGKEGEHEIFIRNDCTIVGYDG